MNKLLAIGFASALALGVAAPAVAAPVMSSTQAVKAAAPDHVTDIQWRRGRGIGPGLAAGAIIGATAGIIAGAAAAPYYAGPYDGPYYGPTYAPGYYEAPVATYEYGPTYYAPAPQYAPRYYGGSCRDDRYCN
jgi:hypothetical protein